MRHRPAVEKMSARLATHHVAKENFAGHKISRAARQSQAAQRQKDKRLVAMSQRRGNILEEAKEAFEEEAKKPAPKLDRRQQLELWKKKRERLVQRQKMNEKKPFKAGSINVAKDAQYSVPKSSKLTLSASLAAPPKVSDAVKPKKLAPKNQPPPSTRTLRSANRPQAQTTKEMPTSRVTRSSATNKAAPKGGKKGRAAADHVPQPQISLPDETSPAQPKMPITTKAVKPDAVRASTVPMSLPVNRRSEIFHTLFPNKFSPFKFNFTKKLNLGSAFTGVTVRGQHQMTPDSELSLDQNSSPALWPPTPSRFPKIDPGTDSSSAAEATVDTPVTIPACEQSKSPSTKASAVGSLTPANKGFDSSSSSECLASATRALRRQSYTLASPSVTAQLPDATPKKNIKKKKSLCYTPSHSSKVAHFRQLLCEKETAFNALCDYWTPLTEEERPEEMSDEVVGRVLSAIGQAKLLMRKRFAQFSRLCDGAEDRYAEKATHSSDLQGLWEMIGVQIDAVEAKFEELKALQSTNWVKTKKTPAKRRRGVKKTDGPAQKKSKTPSKATLAARERMRRFREEARRKMETESSQSSDSIVIAARTPPPSESSTTATESDAAAKQTSLQSTPQKAVLMPAARTPPPSESSTTATESDAAAKQTSLQSTPQKAVLMPALRTTPASESSTTATESDGMSTAAVKQTPLQSTPQNAALMPSAAATTTPGCSAMQSSPQAFDFTQYIQPVSTAEPEPMDTEEKSSSRRSLRSAFEVENITASDDSFTEKSHLAKPLPSQQRLVEFVGMSPAVACSQRLCQLQMNSDTESPKRKEVDNSLTESADCGLEDYIGSSSTVSNNKGGDLISFDSPAPEDRSGVTFMLQFKPVTPRNRRLSRKAEDTHVVLTPVRRSKRLHRKSLVHALSSTDELPDGTAFSVWPNPALEK